MRVLISITIITAALVSVVSDLRAGLAFQHDRTFTVPELSGSIRQMRFNDINGDGTPEVLACDTGKVILYSVTGDSVIFSAVPDSGYQVSAIELADVNRDSVADVTVAFRMLIPIFPSPTYPVPNPAKWRIKCYTGSSGFSTELTDTLSSDIYDTPASLVKAVDLDGDERNELLVSVDSAGGYDYSDFSVHWTGGLSRLYHSFPDSIKWRKNILLTGIHNTTLAGGAVAYLVERDYYSVSHIPVHPDDERYSHALCFLQDSGSLMQVALPAFSTSVPCSYDTFLHFGTALAATGEFDFDQSDRELLAIHNFVFRCFPEMLDSSRSDMSMFRITASQETELVWSVETKGKEYRGFLYHPDLPGYFFAFSGDTLLLFRGINGSVHSRLTDVPAGTRYWDYPYADRKPRLVVTNGTQVSFYQLDVSTDTEEEPARNLPTSFELDQPYPNPFNAELNVSVTISRTQELSIDIFNIKGELVTRLHQGVVKPGVNAFRWDASGVASGIYLVRAQAAGETRTVKAVLLK